MSWEKIGITFVAKLSSTGGGLKVTIPKKVAEAYELYTAESAEVTLDRVRRPQAETEARET